MNICSLAFFDAGSPALSFPTITPYWFDGVRRRCEGEGRVQLRRKVRFRVPAGVVDGQVLRMKGQGHSGKYGGAPGDLLVKLQVRRVKTYAAIGAAAVVTWHRAVVMGCCSGASMGQHVQGAPGALLCGMAVVRQCCPAGLAKVVPSRRGIQVTRQAQHHASNGMHVCAGIGMCGCGPAGVRPV